MSSRKSLKNTSFKSQVTIGGKLNDMARRPSFLGSAVFNNLAKRVKKKVIKKRSEEMNTRFEKELTK